MNKGHWSKTPPSEPGRYQWRACSQPSQVITLDIWWGGHDSGGQMVYWDDVTAMEIPVSCIDFGEWYFEPIEVPE